MLTYSYLISGASLAVFVIILIKLLQLLWNNRNLRAKFKDFPQAPSNFFLGHLLEFPGPNDAGLAFGRERTAIYNRLNLVWLAHLPVLYVNHPDTVKTVLKSSAPKARMLYHFLNPWIGDGLLTSGGSKWIRNRRLLTPAFHFDILKDYLHLKNKLSDDLLNKFDEAAKSGKTLNTFDNISMFTLDVILQSTMSYETGCQKGGEKHPYILAVNRLIAKVVKRFVSPWLHSDFTYFLTPAGISFLRDCHHVHKVADEIITKRQKELESDTVSKENKGDKKKKCRDFLDTLIMARDEDGNGLTKQEIRDEVDTFLFEGHDTTASAISWSLYSIAGHPDVQSRIQAEVDDLFADRENDYLLWEDMSMLPYLTMAVKESMRLHCPVPFTARQMTKDTVIDGHTVPEGTVVSACIYYIHHNATVWGDTMKFDPERFLPEECEKRDPFAFVPFSAGPRNCIGQNFAMDEIKVCLARIFHRYTISLDPNHSVKKMGGIVMKAENDIKLVIKSRFS